MECCTSRKNCFRLSGLQVIYKRRYGHRRMADAYETYPFSNRIVFVTLPTILSAAFLYQPVWYDDGVFEFGNLHVTKQDDGAINQWLWRWVLIEIRITYDESFSAVRRTHYEIFPLGVRLRLRDRNNEPEPSGLCRTGKSTTTQS